MRIKSPTPSWSTRRNSQLEKKSIHEIKEAYFGSQMFNLATKTKSSIVNLMNPSFISNTDLKSGQEEGDMFEAMRSLVLFPADVLAKTTLTVKRMANVVGNLNPYLVILILLLMLFIISIIDKAAQIKLLYDAKLLTYDDRNWRPEGWIAFLMTGIAAGNNCLLTMVPRVNPDNLALTQSKEVRKHAKQASRAVQGLTHKTRGNGSVIDLTDEKVKSVKHYHYLKPEATMDSITLLKRKAETMTSIISSFEELGDIENSTLYKKKHLEINILMLKELDKQDAKVNQSQHLNSSSSSNHDSSAILSINGDATVNDENADEYPWTM